jgi:hypothetical protein
MEKHEMITGPFDRSARSMLGRTTLVGGLVLVATMALGVSNAWAQDVHGRRGDPASAGREEGRPPAWQGPGSAPGPDGRDPRGAPGGRWSAGPYDRGQLPPPRSAQPGPGQRRDDRAGLQPPRGRPDRCEGPERACRDERDLRPDAPRGATPAVPPGNLRPDAAGPGHGATPALPPGKLRPDAAGPGRGATLALSPGNFRPNAAGPRRSAMPPLPPNNVRPERAGHGSHNTGAARERRPARDVGARGGSPGHDGPRDPTPPTPPDARRWTDR